MKNEGLLNLFIGLMMQFLSNLRNKRDFLLRNLFCVKRSGYSETTEDKKELLAELPKHTQNRLLQEEVRLRSRYQLDSLFNHSSNFTYLINLRLLEILEQSLNPTGTSEISILDIGAKNWEYVAALHGFFTNHQASRKITLNGIEIDPWRRNKQFFSRHDIANWQIRNFPQTTYIEGNLLDHEGNYDYITWFFPFLTAIPHLAWGLPLPLLQPEKLLAKTFSLLKTGGELVIYNQSEAEVEIQHQLLSNTGISFVYMNKLSTNFTPTTQHFYLTKCNNYRK